MPQEIESVLQYSGVSFPFRPDYCLFIQQTCDWAPARCPALFRHQGHHTEQDRPSARGACFPEGRTTREGTQWQTPARQALAKGDSLEGVLRVSPHGWNRSESRCGGGASDWLGMGHVPTPLAVTVGAPATFLSCRRVWRG